MPIPNLSPDHTFLNVPNAFRSWAAAANELGYGNMQVHDAKLRVGHECACILREVYSRAIMQNAIAVHFDLKDSAVDVLVFQQIADTFGLDTASAIHTDILVRGPVCRSLADMRGLLAVCEVP